VAVTIYDVAERAGVGIATVSRVLNESPHVRDVTRQRVLEAIEELDYRPSTFAQRLSLRRGLAIGVIVPFFTRPSFVERLRGVEAAVAESEYDLIIYNVETPERRDACFRQVSQRHQLDGLLIISLSPSDENVRHFQRSGVPTVLVDAQHPELDRVVVDDVVGGRLATQHLIDLGHRKIDFVGHSPDNPFHFAASRDRGIGFREALKQARIAPRPELQLRGPHAQYRAKLVAEQLLDSDDAPTAIFAASDTRAMGVLEAMQERGVRVPEDVSVAGYDDIGIAEYLGLTTVRQPLYESGLRGVELLLDALDRPGRAAVEIELPLTLIERRTTGPPRT
jgi:DNA-binding LacI/PurR family transcriptional regulator